jgi:hypothetical protein
MSATSNFTAAQIAAESLRDELLIRTLIKDVRTAIPVKVIAVHPGAGTPPAIGTVDVQPLVQTVDGSGKLWKLGVTYGASFCRAQAGNTAFIVDPAVGDRGLAVACDRDISSVLASGGLAGPGSARTHDISDLVYVLSIKSAVPITQYILANASGITLLSPNTITIQGEQINLVGPVNQTNGDVTLETKVTVPNVDATTDVTVPNGSVNNHVHADPQGGVVGPMTG